MSLISVLTSSQIASAHIYNIYFRLQSYARVYLSSIK